MCIFNDNYYLVFGVRFKICIRIFFERYYKSIEIICFGKFIFSKFNWIVI